MRSRSIKQSLHNLSSKSATWIRSMRSPWAFSPSQLAEWFEAVTSFREPRGQDTPHDPPTTVTKCSIYVSSPRIYPFPRAENVEQLERDAYSYHKTRKTPTSTSCNTLSTRASDMASPDQRGTETVWEITVDSSGSSCVQLEIRIDTEASISMQSGNTVRLRPGNCVQQPVICEEKHRRSYQAAMGTCYRKDDMT